MNRIFAPVFLATTLSGCDASWPPVTSNVAPDLIIDNIYTGWEPSPATNAQNANANMDYFYSLPITFGGVHVEATVLPRAGQSASETDLDLRLYASDNYGNGGNDDFTLAEPAERRSFTVDGVTYDPANLVSPEYVTPLGGNSFAFDADPAGLRLNTLRQLFFIVGVHDNGIEELFSDPVLLYVENYQ